MSHDPLHSPEEQSTEEWSEWLNSWKQPTQSEAQENTMLAQIQQRVYTEQSKLRRNVWIEIIASALVFAYYGYLWSRGKLNKAPMLTIAVFSLLFLVVWLWRVIGTYRSIGQNEGRDTHSYLAHLKKKNEAQQRFVQFTRQVFAFLAGALSIWLVWMFATHPKVYQKAPWRFMLAVIMIGAIFSFLTYKVSCDQRKLDAEAKELTSMFAEIDTNSNDEK